MEEEQPLRHLVSCMQDGFGDFCLFPSSLSCPNSDSFDPWWMPAPDIDSGGTAQLIPSNRDARPFPFLELPKDIRDIIYGYILEPFRNEYDDQLFRVDIRINHRYEAYYSSRKFHYPHPYRNGYTFSVHFTLNPPDPIGLCGGLHYGHELSKGPAIIWLLSKVCRKIRQEIGEAFWSNVHVAARGPLELPIHFLEDRPAACAGIKRFSTEWVCVGSVDNTNDNVIALCDYVAEHLSLDVFNLSFETSVDVARDLVASEGRVEWVQAFRKIKMKRLDLTLGLTGEDPLASDDKEGSDYGSDDSGGFINGKTQKELTPLVAALLRPQDPEGEPEPLSEQQAYLQTRAADFEATMAELDI